MSISFKHPIGCCWNRIWRGSSRTVVVLTSEDLFHCPFALALAIRHSQIVEAFVNSFARKREVSNFPAAKYAAPYIYIYYRPRMEDWLAPRSYVHLCPLAGEGKGCVRASLIFSAMQLPPICMTICYATSVWVCGQDMKRLRFVHSARAWLEKIKYQESKEVISSVYLSDITVSISSSKTLLYLISSPIAETDAKVPEHLWAPSSFRISSSFWGAQPSNSFNQPRIIFRYICISYITHLWLW